MTTDDYFMLLIAFGGFMIAAPVLWGLARTADRKQDSRRDPDTPTDVSSPGASNDYGRENAAAGRPNDFLRRLVSARGGSTKFVSSSAGSRLDHCRLFT